MTYYVSSGTLNPAHTYHAISTFHANAAVKNVDMRRNKNIMIIYF